MKIYKCNIVKFFNRFDELPAYYDYFLLSLLILFIGYYLEAWNGYPKGDDAYLHLTKIKFIIDNFPNVGWNPYQYFGYEPFNTYPYVPYLILAAVYKITGASLETLLIGGLLFSLILFGTSILKLTRLLNISRAMGIVLSLLIFSTPVFWNWSLVGGAYLRLYALPFMILSVLYSIKHIDEINSGKTNTQTFLKVTTVLAITALLHPFIWLFTLPTILLLYILGVKGIRLKIKNLFRIFIPVSVVTFWFYIPYLQMKISVPLHDYTPNPMSGLFKTLPTTVLTLNTLYAFLVIILMLPLLALLLKYAKGEPVKYKRSTVSLLIASLLFSFYHLLFGWFSMPRTMYQISAYDSATWLNLFLLLFIISSYSLFERNFTGKAIKFESIKIGLILLILLELSNTLPLVKDNFMSYTAPDDWRTVAFESKQFLDKQIDGMPDQYRLGITYNRLLTRWINYVYPELKITGGRDVSSQPNMEYQDWFLDRVFYRFDYERYKDMYGEDLPKIRPEYGFTDNKSVSPILWLLDWAGSSGVIFYPNIMLNRNTLQEYLSRPQIFEIESGRTRLGDIYYIKYNKSSPIIVLSDVPTLAIPSDSQNRDNLFMKTLMILSYVNADSKVIIPIKIDPNRISSSKLNQFDSILVTDELYRAYKEELVKYVRNGGNLLIISKGRSRAIESKLNQVTNKTEKIGNGKIAWINASLDEIFDAGDFLTVFNFIQLLNPSLKMEEIDLSTQWKIGFTTENTSSKILYEKENEIAVLNYSINPALKHNQINIFISAMRKAPTDRQGIISLDMYSNNWRNMYADIILKDSNYYNGFLYYPVKLKSENSYPNEGWRKFSVPVSGFRLKGNPDPILKNFNVIEIAINEDAPYNSKNNVVRLRNVTVSFLDIPYLNHGIKIEPKYVRKNPQEIIISLQNRTRGVLLKESFNKNWKSYITRDDKTEELPIYFTGPGFMYVQIPENITAPTNVTFNYESEPLKFHGG
ncbi:Uncharacterised protein [uncultured archaeon]|nr:Uncharacterised protein [uncultured archaeon]